MLAETKSGEPIESQPFGKRSESEPYQPSMTMRYLESSTSDGATNVFNLSRPRANRRNR